MALLLLVLSLPDCTSTGEPLPERPRSIPAEFQRTGMVSSSTYQVYITLFANSREEAQANGLVQARKRALELILNEPFIYMRISDNGRQQLVKLIEEHGRIIMLESLQPNNWGLVFHVQKQGLRSYFQSIH